MTKLSERIEARSGDTTELAAEMLTFVTGTYVFESGGMLVQKPEQSKINIHANPLTDERAIAALEREYLPEEWWPVHIESHKSGNVYVDIINANDDYKVYVKCSNEALARSAALVRALEVSREV